MNSEIENLINMALANGEVSEKERAIILRKAESLGIDKDEVEMILDGKIALMKKKEQSSNHTVPKTNKEGDLKKCPSCGATTQSFTTNCSACGHEFRNIETSQSVQQLFEMLNNLESQRPEEETNPLKALASLYANVFSGRGIYGGSKYDTQKGELIRNFPIPNTKEDILEFLSLAVPRAKKLGGFFGGYGAEVAEITAHNLLVTTWKSKCEQILMKARFAMKDDRKTLEEIEYYAKQLGVK